MGAVDIKHIFPMHFWQDYRIFKLMDDDERTEAYRDRIVKIDNPGQVFKL